MSNCSSGPSAIGLGLGILAFKKGLLLGTAIAGRRTRFINLNINQEYISLIFLGEHIVLDASVTLVITTITTPTTPDPTLTTTTLLTDIPEATEEREMWTVRSFWRCSEWSVRLRRLASTSTPGTERWRTGPGQLQQEVDLWVESKAEIRETVWGRGDHCRQVWIRRISWC